MDWKIKYYLLSLIEFSEDTTQNATSEKTICFKEIITKEQFKKIDKILKEK